MKNLLVILIVLLFISCSPTLTEVWVRDDNSSRIEVSMDLGESINMVGSMMKELDKDEDGSDGEESEEEFNIYSKEEKMDTIMNFYQIMPDSIEEKLSDPEALGIMNLHLKVDSEKEIGIMKMQMEYKNEKELERFYNALSELSEINKSGAMAGGGDTKEMMKQMMGSTQADLKNNIVRIPRSNPLEELEKQGLLEEMKPKLDSLKYMPDDSFERQMIEMLLPSKTKTVIHVPGDVLFTNDPTAIIEGNKVTFVDNALQLIMDGKEMPTEDRIIKFK